MLTQTALLSLILTMPFTTQAASQDPQALRVPAEWETHAATWMQWPSAWEAEMRPEFADIIHVVQAYEPVHVIAGSQADQAAARQLLIDRGVPLGNITWHILPTDNSWLRDNGPVYVTDGRETWIQNWGFDASPATLDFNKIGW